MPGEAQKKGVDRRNDRGQQKRTAEGSISAVLFFLGLSLKYKVNRRALLGGQSYFLGLSPEGFMPCRDRVFTGGQIVQRKCTALPSHRIMRSLQHYKVAVHPRMDVAFDRDELFSRKHLRKRCCSRRLRFIPLAICGGQRMDVV